MVSHAPDQLLFAFINRCPIPTDENGMVERTWTSCGRAVVRTSPQVLLFFFQLNVTARTSEAARVVLSEAPYLLRGADGAVVDRVEMDDAVVGETEEEGDEEEDDKDGTLQDSLRMARSPFTPRRGGGRPDTPARELRRRVIAAGSRGRGVLGH